MAESLLETICAVFAVIIAVSYALIVCRIWRLFGSTPPRTIQPTPDPLCLICYDNVANAIFASCGHGGVCHICAGRIMTMDNRCPFCRCVVRSVVLHNGF